jgi:pimeloyl-ACP methyl ester carboxylesterase
MPAHVDDLIALLGAINAEPAYLVGDSWGGFVALLTAIQRPDLVRGLVLQEPPVLTLFTSATPRPQELAGLLIRRPRTAAAILRFGGGTIAPTERLLRRGEGEQAMERFARGTLGPDVFEALPEARRQQARENIPTLRAQLLGAGSPPLEDSQVRGVEAPTLLVTGELSRPLFRQLIGRLGELLPNARQVEIRGASYSMREQKPAEVNEAILGFLRSTAAG